MKKCLLIITGVLLSTSLFAQSEKDKKAYADEAAQLQKQIWDNPIPEFSSTGVPANLGKESAVILARSYSLSRSSSGKLKFGRAIGITTRTKKLSIYHERVKINDKTALESFSSLEYQKILNKTTAELFTKFMDVNNTFIGAKVVKANGKEIIVNTSEEILTKNESKDKQGKLAIPDLQVGDILDYYICREAIADKEEGNSYKDNDNLIFLMDEHPILYFSINFQFNKKIKVQTIYANGAQHFVESHNDEDDQLFDLKLHNVPKYQSQLWTSGLREYPYIEIGSAYDDELDKTIHKNHFEDKSPMFQAQKYIFETSIGQSIYPYSILEDKYKKYYKDKKELKNTPLDSAMKILYAVWKFDTFCQYTFKDLEDFSSLKYRRASSKVNTTNMCRVLTDLKIDYDIMLVTSRYTNSLENVFGYDDFDAFIRINGDKKPLYMFFDDMVTQFNELPARFQGEKVVVLHPKKKGSFEFVEEDGTLPVIANDQNKVDEHLNVSLLSKDMQKLQIERLAKQTGSMRHDDQKSLMGMDDVDEGLKVAANGASLDGRYSNYVGAKKLIVAVKSTYDKETTEKVKNFNTEIKEKFDQEPEQVTNCKIINPGVDESKPLFQYSETFVLNNLVKKAGNNYIIDAGKLTGGFLKLDEKDKKRDHDVYMPSARSFKYTIVLNIPQGYAARGMEELTQNKSNKTGSFSSTAVLSGDKLTITIIRVYNNNFEKTADWPLMVDVINAASDFDSKKILLEKQ